MTSVSTDSHERWKVTAHEGPACLVVILVKRTYVLPWSQFLYAEGVTMRSASPSPRMMSWCTEVSWAHCWRIFPARESAFCGSQPERKNSAMRVGHR
jgi:hypothetical protein